MLALPPATEGHTAVSMTPITTDQARTIADMDTKSVEGGPHSPHVWVVRANGGKYADHFVSGGYAAVEWESIELSSVDSLDDLRHRYREAYPDDNVTQVGVNVGQLAAFHLGMREGDYVITPTGDTEWLLYGRVAGATVLASPDDGCPYRNRRPVDWAATPVRRHGLSESLQNTLGSSRTVFAVGQREEFLAAIEQPVATSHLAGTTITGAIGTEPAAPPPNPAEPAHGSPDTLSEPHDEADPGLGVEPDRDDPEASGVERPFDPARIKIHTVQAVVGQLMTRIEHDEIDLAPDFQRLSGIWNPERKSRLIESLLLRIPIPVFYVAADEDEKWAVVDGVQRLSTIRDYVTGKFPLTRLEYRGELDGLRYDDLPRAMQRRISETQFVVNVIEPGTPPEVMFNIFRRINTGGIPLNGQEIRHALNPGPVREYLKTLARSTEFVYATNGSIKQNRMADRECVLRFLAFHMEPWEQYSADSLDSHLETAMKAINTMAPDRLGTLAADFRKAMSAAPRIFGNDAFRKRYRSDAGRSLISMPLFETWAVQLARCSPDQIKRLVAQREAVRERFMALLSEDPEFEKAISMSTGTSQRIRKRFAAIRNLVQEFL